MAAGTAAAVGARARARTARIMRRAEPADESRGSRTRLANAAAVSEESTHPVTGESVDIDQRLGARLDLILHDWQERHDGSKPTCAAPHLAGELRDVTRYAGRLAARPADAADAPDLCSRLAYAAAHHGDARRTAGHPMECLPHEYSLLFEVLWDVIDASPLDDDTRVTVAARLQEAVSTAVMAALIGFEMGADEDDADLEAALAQCCRRAMRA